MNTAINTLISLTVVSVIGTVIITNESFLKPEALKASANQALNSLDIRQFKVALEFYYFDHNEYPQTSGSEVLFEILKSEGYIESEPLNPNAFAYRVSRDGQDYDLTIKR